MSIGCHQCYETIDTEEGLVMLTIVTPDGVDSFVGCGADCLLDFVAWMMSSDEEDDE